MWSIRSILEQLYAPSPYTDSKSYTKCHWDPCKNFTSKFLLLRRLLSFMHAELFEKLGLFFVQFRTKVRLVARRVANDFLGLRCVSLSLEPIWKLCVPIQDPFRWIILQKEPLVQGQENLFLTLAEEWRISFEFRLRWRQRGLQDADWSWMLLSWRHRVECRKEVERKWWGCLAI